MVDLHTVPGVLDRKAVPMQQLLSDWERGSLIPPRRLGSLLSEARSGRGVTLEELAFRSGGRFSPAALASIERGTREISDDDARALSLLYELEASSLVPVRSKLMIDLDEGLLVVDDRRAKLRRSAPSRDEVLSRYLTMVYSMRRVQPGAPITLRVDDLDVLGRALRVGSRTLESDLEALMSNPGDLIGWRSRILSRRVLIPAAGILVAALSAGALLLIQDQQPAQAEPRPASGADGTMAGHGATGAPLGGIDVGAAVVQERSPDGTPGAVVVRGG